MNTENIETSITSETISQQPVCGDIKGPEKFPEIPKKFHTHVIRIKNKFGGITETDQDFGAILRLVEVSITVVTDNYTHVKTWFVVQ